MNATTSDFAESAKWTNADMKEAISVIGRLERENSRLRGIIARNAMQRLAGEDAAEMHITHDDIVASIEILHEFQKLNP